MVAGQGGEAAGSQQLDVWRAVGASAIARRRIAAGGQAERVAAVIVDHRPRMAVPAVGRDVALDVHLQQRVRCGRCAAGSTVA